MGNSSAGEDEIPPGVIKKAWPVLKKHITSFFGMCLHNGHHPQWFKSAILCALPKPGKRIRSEPRSYRLIALLSCLGKVLERVVARRLSSFALKAKLFSNLHFGAIPGRSAVDAAATLTHDVEKAMQQQNVVTALAFDIKGAFDNVSKNKLIKRLWDQKISLSLIRWTDSFLTQRTAVIRLDGKTGIQQTFEIGVPQGSPVSPILFMLFTAPLFKILNGENKRAGLKIRAYVDDGLLTSVAASENEAVVKLQEVFAMAKKWVYENGLSFDLGKFEAIHFSRKQNLPNPSIHLRIGEETELVVVRNVD